MLADPGIGKRTHLDGWGNRTNKLGEGNSEEFREHDREQLESGPVEPSRSTSVPNRVNHQNPIHDRTDDGVRDLRQELRDGENLRRVESAVGFTNEST